MENAYNVNPIYLKHDEQAKVIDYRVRYTVLYEKNKDYIIESSFTALANQSWKKV